MTTEIEYFGSSFFSIEITVPADLMGHQGSWDKPGRGYDSWDDDAEFYGPELQRLNPMLSDADMIMIRVELAELGLGKNWHTEPDDIVWQYVSWILAFERKDRKS